MSVHALLSPSSASRWLACPASVGLSKDIPDVRSKYSTEGTAAHLVASYCLEDKNDAVKHVGKMYAVDDIDAYLIEEEMASYVQVYLDYVRRESRKKKLLVEQRLPLTPLTGEADAFGTADAVIIDNGKLTIVDLKYGMGVKVYAKENKQMMMYAAAAAIEYGVVEDFTKFKVVVVQPRLDHIDEWEFDIHTAGQFLADIKQVAPFALAGGGLFSPAEDTCRFCKAKAICPALYAKVAELTSDGFENLDAKNEIDLSKAMRSVGMVEDWCTAIRAETERRLIAGEKVAGWKLVQGRMGARQWADSKAAEETMKGLKIPNETMYKSTLISPTQAEKALVKLPDQWSALQAFITQKQGSPSVAPSTDPRPDMGAVSDSFSDLGEAA